MDCPHCLKGFFDGWTQILDAKDSDAKFVLEHTRCPSCRHIIVRSIHQRGDERTATIVYPRSVSRAALPPEVPEQFASDYREACAVLSDSSKASAALSRRCLQNLIHNHFSIRERDLSTEIDRLIEKRILGSEIEDAIDAIRNLGNFAAHPIKSTNSGEIVDVEPGEAEWCLDVLEDIFDYCFVAPARRATRKAALNAKLADSGKPPAK